MSRWFAMLFIVLPASEIILFVLTAKQIGGLSTFALVVLTSFLGAYLAKQEGRIVWGYAQHQLQRGELPADSLLDGICVFAGGVLLLIPGFLTDAAGLFMILPFTRSYAKPLLLRFIRRQLNRGAVSFHWRW